MGSFTYNVAGSKNSGYALCPRSIVQKLQEEIQVLEHELNHELLQRVETRARLG